MSKQTPSQDSVSDLEKVWKEMDEIEPLTFPSKNEYNEFEAFREDALRAYKEAALSDAYMFGEYDGYEAFKRED